MAGGEVPHSGGTGDDETSECAVSGFWFAGKPEGRGNGPPLPIKRARREGREERLAHGLQPLPLRRAFGALLIVVSIRMLWSGLFP